MTDSPGSYALSFAEALIAEPRLCEFIAESLVAEFISESRPHKVITESPVVEPIAEAELLAREYFLGTHEAFPAELLFTEWLLEPLVRESFTKLLSPESVSELLVRTTELPFPEFLVGEFFTAESFIRKRELSLPEFLIRELLPEFVTPESLGEFFSWERELPFSEFLVGLPFTELLTSESLAGFLVAPEPLASFFTGESLPKFLTAESSLTELLASLRRLLRLGLHRACPRTHLTAGGGACS